MRSDGIRDIIDRIRQNRATEQRLGRLWIRNILRNYLRTETVRSFADLRTSLPVILIGAGLSLESEIAHIRRVASGYCVVAVDTALPVLRAYDIEPDVVIAMESQIYNMRDFLVGVGRRTIVALDITAHPSLLRILAAAEMPDARSESGGNAAAALFSSDFADIALLDTLSQHNLRPLSIPALGSVGVAALYLCLTLTADNIYIVGLDFNYKMGKTHCRGAPFLATMAESAAILNPDPLYAFCMARGPRRHKDKNGRRSLSEPTLINGNALLRQLCSQYERVYDCGNEGLYLTTQRAQLSELPSPQPTARSRQQPKVTYAQRTQKNTQRERARALIAALHDRLQRLLALDADQYMELFADTGRGAALPSGTQLADVDFLDLDRGMGDNDRPSIARHYRYSALDYHHRLTRYLKGHS